EREELAGGGTKTGHFLGAPPLRPGEPETSHHGLLVDVEAAADAIEDVHILPSLTAPLRRRDSMSEYPLRAPRAERGRQSEVPVTPWSQYRRARGTIPRSPTYLEAAR